MKDIRKMSSEELENLQFLDLDDTFEFGCKECGKCCRQREDILLTPYDLFRIAGFSRRTPEEIFKRYCEVYEGHSSHMPVVRIVPIPSDNACPFLRNKKCVVHAKKPGVCRAFPLARVYTDGNVKYYFSGLRCRAEPKSITVREWVADFASEESQQVGILWGEIAFTIHHLINPDVLKVSAETREQILGFLFVGLYLNYDTKEPFAPQLERNYAEIKALFELAAKQNEGT